MRVIIPTRVHLPRMKAHLMFKREDVIFIVDDGQAQAQLNETLPGYASVVAGVSRDTLGVCTIARVREFVSQQVLFPNEWALLVDDNVERLTRVSDEYYNDDRVYVSEHTSKEWRAIYATPADPYALAAELRDKCIEQGTIFGGLAAEENYFYRTNKWSRCSYTKTKFAVWCNDRALSWAPFPECMFEDFVMTVQVVAKYGSVANNRFARMHNTYYEAGGIGSFEDRLEPLKQNCAWLMEHYPGLLKHTRDELFLLSFAIRHPSTVLAWRKEHGYV